MQFSINYLAHFLFFDPLKPTLLTSATTKCSSRVINLSLLGYCISSINESNNYNFEKGRYYG